MALELSTVTSMFIVSTSTRELRGTVLRPAFAAGAPIRHRAGHSGLAHLPATSAGIPGLPAGSRSQSHIHIKLCARVDAAVVVTFSGGPTSAETLSAPLSPLAEPGAEPRSPGRAACLLRAASRMPPGPQRRQAHHWRPKARRWVDGSGAGAGDGTTRSSGRGHRCTVPIDGNRRGLLSRRRLGTASSWPWPWSCPRVARSMGPGPSSRKRNPREGTAPTPPWWTPAPNSG